MSQITAIAARHGINQKIVNGGPVDEHTNTQSIVVLVPSTMGEMTCDIQFSGESVVSAKVFEP